MRYKHSSLFSLAVSNGEKKFAASADQVQNFPLQLPSRCVIQHSSPQNLETANQIYFLKNFNSSHFFGQRLGTEFAFVGA
jgi:hypothetical protein